MFQKQHFEALARTLRNSKARDSIAHETIVSEIADMLVVESWLDRRRFVRACGVNEDA